MIPDAATLKEMPGGDVLSVLVDALRDEAGRIEGLETTLLKIGHIQAWDESRASAHHALRAAAEIVDRFRALGAEAAAAKKNPAPVVMSVVGIARSMLISERIRQTNPPALSTTKPETDDADAA